MIWYPKTLKCEIYENKERVDLNSCGDTELEKLADAIFPIIRSPTNSAVWMDIEIYEKHYWFRPPKNTLEVVAFIAEPYEGKKQVSVSKLNMDKFLGKGFKIKAENTIMRKWSDDLVVRFVI